MNRSDLRELHFITPIENLISISANGILSHKKAAALEPRSIADPRMQERRRLKAVPSGKRLHEYANLYFCGRNPMLFRRLNERNGICVLSVSTDVLDLEGVVVTDRNAASGYVRFYPSPDGLKNVDHELTFAEWWTDAEDPINEYRQKSAKCAEVLVPGCVEPKFIKGAYVCNQSVRQRIAGLDLKMTVTINSHLFFGRT